MAQGSRSFGGRALVLAVVLGGGLSACSGKTDAQNGAGGSSGVSSGGSSGGGTVAHVGEPCVPFEETSDMYNGSGATEVVIDEPISSCGGYCVLNHMDGRVSCPYGQTEDDLAQGAPRCFVPGSDKPVTVPVAPQRIMRQASTVAVCSCRCAGPAGSGPYCACPSGTGCVELVRDLGLMHLSEYTGSYCVPDGTAYDPTSPPGDTCDRQAMNCGDPRPD